MYLANSSYRRAEVTRQADYYEIDAEITTTGYGEGDGDEYFFYYYEEEEEDKEPKMPQPGRL